MQKTPEQRPSRKPNTRLEAGFLPVAGAFPTLFDSVDFAAGYTQFSYYMSPGTDRLMLAQQGDNVAAWNVDVAAVTTSSVLRGIAIFPV